MNNWKVIFATVVIFGTGVITGGLLVNYVHYSHPKLQRSKPSVAAEVRPQATNSSSRSADNVKLRPAEVLNKQFLLQLDTALHLKSDQRAEIQKIIGEGQNQMRKVILDARLEIREVLTAEQQKEFDDLVKRPLRRPQSGTNTTVALPPATNFVPASTNTP